MWKRHVNAIGWVCVGQGGLPAWYMQRVPDPISLRSQPGSLVKYMEIEEPGRCLGRELAGTGLDWTGVGVSAGS